MTIKNDIDNQDEENRSTPLGYFNFADSYWRAAQHLHGTALKSTHPESPVRFLYYHAIEIYLKSFLRFNGISAKELRGRKFGHRICCLSEKAAALGMILQDENKEVISLIATTDALIRSRYLQTGYFSWPSVDALDRTCNSFRTSIGGTLRQGGLLIRL
jgi:hypothetical protein